MNSVDMILKFAVGEAKMLKVKAAENKCLLVCNFEDFVLKAIPTSLRSFILLLLFGSASYSLKTFERLELILIDWFGFNLATTCLMITAVMGCISIVTYNVSSIKKVTLPVLEVFAWAGFNGSAVGIGGMLALCCICLCLGQFTELVYLAAGLIFFSSTTFCFALLAATGNFDPIRDAHDESVRQSAQLAAQQHITYVIFGIIGLVFIVFLWLVS